ncbi:Trehalose import ATP-binding protein SugC [Beijerinckiaceae bacterium RH AL1]|nr:ABC transporter ATP-binding protein [Beijerinckiaceae bacterium]VVB43244.1 Trehalose import ATP-binding protein SugC [Beijerinckiaceae bacterium RH AL8]VVB43259.1 Trehalose import ATP-binding protein SugC [Beijerinckiaceae bacterium RH CH11]VVC53743.1 Trehalose import ATP-binding protein SugC [Beijerinckiaceae bacterium RH AL1]
MARLRLDDVTKVYGKAASPAVDRLSLDLADGEVMALLGSSGCGKTSTLRMIAGFEEVTAGTIRLGERAIHELAPARRDVAMAFEGYSLYPPLTVRDNIGFALLRDRARRAEAGKRVAEVAAMLEIESVLDRHPVSIASGQQQRASLARALVRDAALHLLDEPMSQLEPRLRAILRARIKDWIKSRRLTVVFVTHDQTEALALADRVAVMEKGELQQYDTPQALRERPANLFVAGFIGEPAMKVAPAHIERQDDRPVIVAADGAIRLALPASLPLADGAAVSLGLRPHRLRLGGSDLKGTTIANFWLGDQTQLAFDVGRAPDAMRCVAVLDGGVDAAIGSEVALSAPLNAIHVFDSAGKAIVHAGVPA